QVGEAGHDGVGLALGQVQQRLLQTGQDGGDAVDLIAHVQTDVGGDLVVAGATGMQLLAGHADAAGQLGLDVHVHVFELHRPVEATGGDVLTDGLEPPYDVGD